MMSTTFAISRFSSPECLGDVTWAFSPLLSDACFALQQDAPFWLSVSGQRYTISFGCPPLFPLISGSIGQCNMTSLGNIMVVPSALSFAYIDPSIILGAFEAAQPTVLFCIHILAICVVLVLVSVLIWFVRSRNLNMGFTRACLCALIVVSSLLSFVVAMITFVWRNGDPIRKAR